MDGNTGLSACSNDCNGDAGGTSFFDECGICSEGNTGHHANSDKDYHGDCFGSAFIDSCGVCSEENSSHIADSDKDCNGTCFGNIVVDCNGICGGASALDSSGLCLEASDSIFNQSCRGCDGVLNSAFEWDTCRQCLLTTDSNFNNCSTSFVLFDENRLEIKLFPHPFSDCTNIVITPLPRKKLSFVLFDLQGKQLFEIEKTSSGAFNLCDSRMNGIYYYRITCDSQLVATGKLIVM
ncbi:MAG: T9SS type A sorting domain-containing protein [Chitinophagales bacterium]|nr:T9SS type A sorting domain-containing protein [Chitinophagales bacterium]